MIKIKSVLRLLALCLLPSLAIAANEIEERAKPVETAELLSKHETTAVFKGIIFKKCMGRTARCPKDCGHSGEVAQFEITAYTNYEKPGEYGDPKQEKYVIQISDFDKKPLAKDSNGNDLAEVLKVTKGLKEGDEVTLNWDHLYITSTNADGTSSKFPRRVLQKLVKKEAK